MQRLLGTGVRRDDLDELLYRAFDTLARELERKRYDIVDRPRARKPGPNPHPRRVPAEVKRAVVARDGGQCTFVSDSGRRCEARERLEFDRAVAVARGGEATAGNLRLRCRAHNRLEAERTYGAEYMRHKREAAREAAERRKRERDARASAEAATRTIATAEHERVSAEARAQVAAVEEVIPWLRALRIGKEQARVAAELACRRLPGAPLEDRVRLGLQCSARSRPQGPLVAIASAIG